MQVFTRKNQGPIQILSKPKRKKKPLKKKRFVTLQSLTASSKCWKLQRQDLRKRPNNQITQKKKKTPDDSLPMLKITAKLLVYH